MKNIRICDGVDLHIINAPKFKTNLLSVYFNIPLKRETVTKAALLPAVLKRGCTEYPTLKDMSRHLDDLYSTNVRSGIRSKGDGEVLYFSAEYISDKYTDEKLTVKVTDFLKSLIFSPLTENGGFNAEYTESEKINLKNAIQSLVNDKKEYAEVKCREAMFGKDGCGMYEAGYEEDLPHITPQNLYEFYKDVLDNSKVDIFISGTVDDEIAETVKSTLGGMFNPRSSSYITSEIAPYGSGEVKRITEPADVVQSKLCMGLICGTEPDTDEYYALVLATCIFGGSPISKLFNNVREKLSLAYYAFSKTAKFKSYMIISSGIQTENFQAAYDEIMLQFEKMKSGEIDDFEMSAAKKYLTNAYNSIKDSLRGMEDYYLSQTITGKEQSIDELLDRVTSVNKDEVMSVMNKVKLDTVYFLKGEEASV